MLIYVDDIATLLPNWIGFRRNLPALMDYSREKELTNYVVSQSIEIPQISMEITF